MLNPLSPLILTLELDATSFAYFDALRKKHFPAQRNHVPAHLTLFHQLPAVQIDEIQAKLREITQKRRALSLYVTGLRKLGRGTAFHILSPELAAVWRQLYTYWEQHLTTQDKRLFQPHITVQNKVPPHEANRLYDDLMTDFIPFDAVGVGLLLHRYLGGPWESVARYAFATTPHQPQSPAVANN